ncbi:MAG: hypothetical protein WBI53_01560 [Paludibacter sp.]
MKYRAEYCRIVEDWRKSSLNRADYCKDHKYNASTFDGWINKSGKLAKEKSMSLIPAEKLPKSVKHPAFVPLQIENSPHRIATPGFELRYPNGVSLAMSALPCTEELSRIVHLYRRELCSR